MYIPEEKKRISNFLTCCDNTINVFIILRVEYFSSAFRFFLSMSRFIYNDNDVSITMFSVWTKWKNQNLRLLTSRHCTRFWATPFPSWFCYAYYFFEYFLDRIIDTTETLVMIRYIKITNPPGGWQQSEGRIVEMYSNTASTVFRFFILWRMDSGESSSNCIN